MRLTWLDSNSWIIDLAGQKILLDPWLVGSLTFGNQTWLFEGKRRQPLPLPTDIDLILLSQGLEDHAHPPTLKALNHSWPVVGSTQAAQVVQNLGYTQVAALKPGERYVQDNRFTIEALPGAPTGPNQIENAYLLTDLTTNERLYYEPHGYHAPELANLDPVDVILTPVLGISLLGVLPVLKGQDSALQVCRWLRPRFIVPTAGAAEIEYSGLLTKVLRLDGSLEEFQRRLEEAGLSAQVLDPQVGQALDLSAPSLV